LRKRFGTATLKSDVAVFIKTDDRSLVRAAPSSEYYTKRLLALVLKAQDDPFNIASASLNKG
jgi:hypothetical protein